MARLRLSGSREGDSDRVRRRALGRRWTACGVLFSLVACVWAGSGSSAWAKKKIAESRRVTGVVLDGDDNPIAGATVELTDKQNGKKLALYTGDDGKYLFADLDPYHDYEVKALSKSLSSDVRQVSSLDGRDKIVIILRVPPAKEE
jgi:hypothetical protein